MSKELVLAELLTPPGAREFGANYTSSGVGMQSPHSDRSERVGVSIRASKVGRFRLLLGVGMQRLSPDDRDRHLSQVWRGGLFGYGGTEALVFLRCWVYTVQVWKVP